MACLEVGVAGAQSSFGHAAGHDPAIFLGRLILANFSVDGRQIVTASEIGVAQVWDEQAISGRWNGDSKKMPRPFKHDKAAEIASASFDRTGKLLLTADFDGGVYLWHAQTGERWANWRPHDRPTVAALAPDGTLIATASYGDGHPRLWASDPWNPEAAPIEIPTKWGPPHASGVTELTFDAGGDRLVSTSFDGTARVWRTCDGALLLSLTHGGPQFSPPPSVRTDGNSSPVPGTARRVCGHCRRQVRRAARPVGHRSDPPPENIKPLLTLGHGAKVTSVAFDATGRQIVTAALDGSARIWDASSGALLRRLQGPEEVAGRFASAAISPDGGTVLATFMQRRAYLWHLKTETTLPRVKNLPARPLANSASADMQRIAVASDSALQVFDAGSGEPLRTIAMDRPPLSVAMSPGGVFVAAAVGSKVGIWSADGEAPSYRELPDQGSLVLSVAYDAFGQRLVTTCQDGSVRLWDATGQPLLGGKSLFADRTPQKPSAVFAAVFGGNGSEIFAGSFDGWLRVADAMSGKELPKRAQLLKRPILGLTVTDDQRCLVADTLADAEVRRDLTSTTEHTFTVAPMVLDASGHSPAAADADIAGTLEMLQTGNALDVTDEQGRRSIVVVPLDRRFRLSIATDRRSSRASGLRPADKVVDATERPTGPQPGRAG